MSDEFKRSLKRESIKIWCTPEEKENVRARAEATGAKSVSDYLLTLGLNSVPDEYESAREIGEGPLLNAEVYGRLFGMIEALEQRHDAETPLVKDAIKLIHEVRRDIAINRQPKNLEQDLI